MPKTAPFDEHAVTYDDWFEQHPFVYEAEVRAVGKALPGRGRGLEIGVGSGRFAVPFGIGTGVEPSEKMRDLARARGLDAVRGTGERLPFADGTFDFALFVTTICFLDDIERSFREAHRILRRAGTIVVGFVEKNSPLGKEYEERKAESVFYHEAVFKPLKKITAGEPVAKGHGRGSFLVIRGRREGIM